MALGYIGIILALVVLIIGTFNRVGIIPMTMIASLIVIIFNRLPLWDTISGVYAPGLASGYASYILIFCFSCLYSKLMEQSGSAAAISYKLIDLVGKKNVMTACCIVAALLVYGGVSGFVIAYILVPIMFTLFSEADIPRHLCMGPIMFGCGTFVMGIIPGSTQLTNVILANAFGTSLVAAPVMGLLASAFCAVFALIYLNRQVKKAQARGEHFTFPEGTDANNYKMADRSLLPSPFIAFIPVLVMILMVIIGSHFVSNTTMLTVGAIIVACILCYVLNFKTLNKKDPKNLITSGIGEGIVAVSGLAAVTGMGQVILSTDAYANLIELIIHMDTNVYLKGAVAAWAMSAVTGSSAAGTRVVIDSLGEYFVSAGVNLGWLQRIMCAFSLSGTSLPNCAGHYIHLNLIKMTQGDCYRHTFVVNTIACLIAGCLCLIFALIAG